MGSVADCANGIEPCDPGCKKFGIVEPPAPEPQPGGDEAERIARFWRTRWSQTFEGTLSTENAFLNVAREAYAAGRARGIEDERKRCEGIARNASAQRKEQADRIKSRMGENQDYSAVADLAEELKTIADAIAKETKS